MLVTIDVGIDVGIDDAINDIVEQDSSMIIDLCTQVDHYHMMSIDCDRSCCHATSLEIGSRVVDNVYVIGR